MNPSLPLKSIPFQSPTEPETLPVVPSFTLPIGGRALDAEGRTFAIFTLTVATYGFSASTNSVFLLLPGTRTFAKEGGGAPGVAGVPVATSLKPSCVKISDSSPPAAVISAPTAPLNAGATPAAVTTCDLSSV